MIFIINYGDESARIYRTFRGCISLAGCRIFQRKIFHFFQLSAQYQRRHKMYHHRSKRKERYRHHASEN